MISICDSQPCRELTLCYKTFNETDPALEDSWKQIGEAVDLPFYIYWMANTADKAVTPEVYACSDVEGPLAPQLFRVIAAVLYF